MNDDEPRMPVVQAMPSPLFSARTDRPETPTRPIDPSRPYGAQ